jgi:putative ABC transport system permease protein
MTLFRKQSFQIAASELREGFAMALSAIGAHKLRSALTLIGVVIGVFSIIVVMTAMRVMQQDVEKEISQLGSLTFVIRKWPGIYFGGPDGFEKYWRRKNITVAQADQLRRRTELPASIGMETRFWTGDVQTKYNKSAPSVSMFGETAGSFSARNWNLLEGRLLLDGDVDGARDVCVLGYNLATNAFPFGSALGEHIKLSGINYSVIGVLEPQGQTMKGNQDNFAVIPITTGMNRFGRWIRSVDILVQARDQKSFDATVDEVRGVMRLVRKVPPGKEDDFEVFSNDSLIGQFHDFTFAIRLGIMFVSSISLIAAGIGIMNIMLVSVTERTREIGIRRAIGAKKRNIMSQFIMEAVVLCEIGGLIGVLLGIAGGNATAILLHSAPAIPMDWAILGLVICSIVGIAFGTYPAVKAANLDPIESLRYE